MQILFNETEKLLDKWKHPDPYRPPSAPGGTQYFSYSRLAITDILAGSKYERNLPAPDLPPPPQDWVKKL
jgi:NADH dehydrogenase (ubiquinone) 1 beta subcomplex subunit 9